MTQLTKYLNYVMFQKFKFVVQAVDTEEQLVSIINLDPTFMVQEPGSESYKFIINAFNDKGDSQVVEIDKDSIVTDEIGEYQ